MGSQTQSEWENSRTPTLTTLPFAVEYLLVFHVGIIRCDKLASKKEILLAIGIEVPVEILIEKNNVDSIHQSLKSKHQ